MKKEKFIVQPYYEGGIKAIKKKVSENMQYPATALEKKVEGTVFLKFDIDYKGQVIAARVITSVGYGCDEEAIRLVKLLRYTVPKQPNGLKVVFHKEIYIHFRLPKDKPTPIEKHPLAEPQPIEIAYNYAISTKKQEEKRIETPKKSFQIVLKY